MLACGGILRPVPQNGLKGRCSTTRLRPYGVNFLFWHERLLHQAPPLRQEFVSARVLGFRVSRSTTSLPLQFIALIASRRALNAGSLLDDICACGVVQDRAGAGRGRLRFHS
jgi:hypothetical protein